MNTGSDSDPNPIGIAVDNGDDATSMDVVVATAIAVDTSDDDSDTNPIGIALDTSDDDSDTNPIGIAADSGNDGNMSDGNLAASAVAVPVPTPSKPPPLFKRPRDFERAVDREVRKLQRTAKVDAGRQRQVLSNRDKHAVRIAEQYQQNPVMRVRTRDANRIQELVREGIIAGALATSVQHISETVPVRSALHTAARIQNGSYTAELTQATLQHVRRLAAVGKISDNTLSAVELYHARYDQHKFVELAEEFQKNPLMMVTKGNAERIQAMVKHGIITGPLATSVEHISKSVSERKAMQMAAQIVDGSYSGPVSQASMDHVVRLADSGSIPAPTMHAVKQYQMRNAPERQRLIKRERKLLHKNNKSYAYSEVPLAGPCEFCGCKLLRGEMQTVKNKKTSALCCMNGELLIDRAKVHDPKTRPQTRTDDNPKELEALLCKKLGQYSRELNKMFGLTSIGAKRKEDECLPEHLRRKLFDFQKPDVGALRCNGLTYHVIFPADRDNDDTPTGDKRCGLTYYVYDDHYHEVASTFAERMNEPILKDLLDNFRRYMKAQNPHVKALEPIFETRADGTPNPRQNAGELRIVLEFDADQQELAYFVKPGAGPSGELREICFRRKGHTRDTFVSCKSPLYDTLQFPVLHPKGELGWYPAKLVNGRKFTLLQYTRCEIMQDVGDRLLRLEKLGQEKMLSSWLRVLEDRSVFWRGKTLQTRVCRIKSLVEPRFRTANVGILLPGKIRGSAAHAAEQVEKSMCVVARCGMPTYFITLTMNPNWPELKHLCEPGYPPPPTATCRVFKQKLKELFKRLKKWDGGMVYYMYVIEFQHRGLPHIHLAMRTRNDNPDLRAMNADINHEMGGDVKIRSHLSPHIQTSMPTHVRDSNGDIVTEEFSKDGHPDEIFTRPLNALYRELLVEHCLHGCVRKVGPENDRLRECRICKKSNRQLEYCRRGYPHHYQTEPLLSESGYPVYRRTPLDADNHKEEIAILEDWIQKKKKGIPVGVQAVDELVRRIVPHSRELLEAFHCHNNVEWAYSVKLINYLYKYMHKNEQTANIAVSAVGNDNQIDHFLRFQRCSSIEATWKLLGFDESYRSVKVNMLQTHVPGERWVALPDVDEILSEEDFDAILEDLNISDQDRYLKRPDNGPNGPDFDALTYAQYFEQYAICKPAQLPKYAINSYHLDKAAHGHQRCVYKRRGTNDPAEGPEHISVLHKRSPKSGEAFYLRLLLNTKLWVCTTCPRGASCQQGPDCKFCYDHQPRDYRDLRTGPTGKEHQSYQESAADYDLMKGQDEHTFLFDDEASSTRRTPAQLRDLFALCILADELFQSEKMWSKYCDTLSRDIFERKVQQGDGTSAEQMEVAARVKALQCIDDILQAAGASLTNFVAEYTGTGQTELDQYKIEHPASRYVDAADAASRRERKWDDSAKRFEDRPADEPALTSEQKPVFDRVMRHISKDADPNECKLTFVSAQGGRGKTWLMNLIVAAARAKGKVVLCVASTAAAASHYPGGRTAHSQFGIPVSDDPVRQNEAVSCVLDLSGTQAAFLDKVDLIVWDEIGNQHVEQTVAVSTLLCDLKKDDRPFGGIPMLCGGDFRQIPPVVESNAYEDTCNAMLSSSAWLWPQFEICNLTHPVRDAQDPEYSEYVDSLGDGTTRKVEEQGTLDEHPHAARVCLPPQCDSHTGIVESEDALIHAVYGDDLSDLLTRPQDFNKHAILCTTNQRVRDFNRQIVDLMNPSGLKVCRSYDTLPNGDAMHHDVIDHLGSHSGVPQHELQLFPGALVRVMRNYSPHHGLINGARARVAFVGENVIGVHLLGQHRNAGTDPLLLPRIRFKQRLNRYDRRTPSVTRLQFPVALAYAMTYNRAQGATLAKVGIDVREPSFMHGHTYVAFSRAQSRDAVVVLTSPGVHSVVNVVYAEILKHLGQDAEHRRKSIQSMAAARVAAQAHRASNVS